MKLEIYGLLSCQREHEAKDLASENEKEAFGSTLNDRLLGLKMDSRTMLIYGHAGSSISVGGNSQDGVARDIVLMPFAP